MAAPRFLADEMVGRLARYLRMMGADTTYARGRTDEEIAREARQEARVVVTRDRALAGRADRSILLESPRIDEQVRAVWAAVPELPHELRFDRCTLCNAALVPGPGPATDQVGVPWDRIRDGLPVYRCVGCHQLFWDGSHVSAVRRRLRDWSEASRR